MKQVVIPDYFRRDGTAVSGSVYVRADNDNSESRSGRGICQKCGSEILFVPMQNGGWVVFEGEENLSSVVHPCFNRGRNFTKSAKGTNLDLFED